MFNVATVGLAIKQYTPHKSLLEDQKKISLYPQKINEAVFSFKCPKFRVRVNHTLTHNQHNQTQLHKVNDA